MKKIILLLLISQNIYAQDIVCKDNQDESKPKFENSQEYVNLINKMNN